MFDCCGSGCVCCSRLRPEAHQKQPQKQPFPLGGELGGAFSSQQWLFSGPCTRSSDLRRATRQSKLLETLGAAEPLWDASSHLQRGSAVRECPQPGSAERSEGWTQQQGCGSSLG